MELRLNHLAIHLTFERLSLTVVLLKTYDNFNEISRVQNSIFQNFLMDLFIYKFQWLWCSFQFFFFFFDWSVPFNFNHKNVNSGC